MDPITINLAVAVIEAAIKVTPELVTEFQVLFSKSTPTADDFAALRARVAALDYKTAVPNSALES
jgi:hypothetical protein